MTSILELTEGWTSAIDFQLWLNNAPFDATGMNVVAVLRDREGQQVTVTTAWSVQASSQARITPDATTFVLTKGPYTVRFKVTDGSGKNAYFPQGEAAKIAVYRA